MVKYYALLGVTIVLETLGTTLLKLSDGFNKPIYGVLSLVAFGLLFYLFLFVIRHILIGVAYAIWSALGIVLISLVGQIYGSKARFTCNFRNFTYYWWSCNNTTFLKKHLSLQFSHFKND